MGKPALLKCLPWRVPAAKSVSVPTINSETTRITGSRWLEIRRRHLAKEPLCRKCAELGRVTAGDEVDHITPIVEGGHPMDAANLQTLCIDHHWEKTASEFARRNEPVSCAPKPAYSKEIREEAVRVATARKRRFQ